MPPNSELYGVRLQAQLAAARASSQTELAAVQATHRGEIEAIKTKHDQESARLLGEVSLYSYPHLPVPCLHTVSPHTQLGLTVHRGRCHFVLVGGGERASDMLACLDVCACCACKKYPRRTNDYRGCHRWRL